MFISKASSSLKKTKNNSCVTDIVESLNIHQTMLDETPDLNELEIAIKS